MMTAPHNASSAIGIAAAVHACAAIPNLLALEFHAMPGWDRILAGYRPRISAGSIEIRRARDWAWSWTKTKLADG